MHTLRINRTNLADCSWHTQTPDPLSAGQVRFAIQTFALSANNITYADLGESFQYWQFFPTAPGFGQLPIWGFACVLESQHADFQPGQRVYGYWPLATEAILTPKTTSAATFIDSAAHRANLPMVYQMYHRQQAELNAAVDILEEGRYALLRPLYMTSWLCADFLRDQAGFAAEQIVVLSASSKTALACGAALKRLNVNAKRIGLTSSANIAFVTASDCFDVVQSYDAIEQLPQVPSIAVDMAGNGDLLRRVHTRLGSALHYSASVGLSHRNGLAAGQRDFVGVQPKLFFAPEQVKKRTAEFGPGWIEQNSRADWASFLSDSKRYLPLKHTHDLEGIRDGYLDLLAGRSAANIGLVYSFDF